MTRRARSEEACQWCTGRGWPPARCAELPIAGYRCSGRRDLRCAYLGNAAVAAERIVRLSQREWVFVQKCEAGTLKTGLPVEPSPTGKALATGPEALAETSVGLYRIRQ
jgi:hypothetical protein